MDTHSSDRTAAQRARARRFVELHRSGCFLLPNAWDAGSARVLESVGFPALATTSAGVAFSYGRPDHDFFAEQPPGGRLAREPMLARVREIVDEVRVPVSADLEEGYGESPDDVADTIALTLSAGAAGGNIEDFTGDRARPLYEQELAADRIRAARAAVDAAGEPFVLVGRTDALLTGASAGRVRRAGQRLSRGRGGLRVRARRRRRGHHRQARRRDRRPAQRRDGAQRQHDAPG